jgi:hypothetical protein
VARRHEWHQFRLLSRDSVRRLLDSVLVARDADPMLFALWFMALAMTPPLARGRTQVRAVCVSQEGARRRWSCRSPPRSDRSSFSTACLATACSRRLTWDALFPDRNDQEIVGALPVRPRTLAGARLAAALGIGTMFAAANQPARGVDLQRRVIDASTHRSVSACAGWPRHRDDDGCACTFLGLMSLRAIVVICAGERVADRLALVLQFVTIVMLVETFLFLPSVLPKIIKALLQDHASYAWAPPVWFTALFLWIAEGNSVLGRHAITAVSVTGTVTVLVLLVSSAAFRLDRAKGSGSALHANARPAWLRWRAPWHCVWVRGPAVRSLFLFGVSSLVRSRPPHDSTRDLFRDGDRDWRAETAPPLLSLRGSLVLDAPRAYTISVPLVLMFFAVFGLRAAFTIPTELDANWVLRLVPADRARVRARQPLAHRNARRRANLAGMAALHARDVADANGSWRHRRLYPVTGLLLTETRTEQLD